MSDLYLRLSVTDRCNLRCRYCRPARALEPHGGSLSDDEILEVVRRMHAVHPLAKVRLTGGEPLLRPALPGLVERLRHALPRALLALTTNGLGLRELARPLRHAGLQALNVSLDTLDPARFAEATGGGQLGHVLEGIAAARDAGYARLRLNAVLQRSVNGERLPDLARFAVEIGAELRFIELMPIGVAASLFDREYVSADEALALLGRAFTYRGLLDARETARRHLFLVDGQEAVIGVITPVSHPFCSSCNRLRLDARGRLYACLRQDGAEGADLASLLRAGRHGELDRVLRAEIAGKCPVPDAWRRGSMAAIGG